MVKINWLDKMSNHLRDRKLVNFFINLFVSWGWYKNSISPVDWYRGE